MRKKRSSTMAVLYHTLFRYRKRINKTLTVYFILFLNEYFLFTTTYNPDTRKQKNCHHEKNKMIKHIISFSIRRYSRCSVFHTHWRPMYTYMPIIVVWSSTFISFSSSVPLNTVIYWLFFPIMEYKNSRIRLFLIILYNHIVQ